VSFIQAWSVVQCPSTIVCKNAGTPQMPGVGRSFHRPGDNLQPTFEVQKRPLHASDITPLLTAVQTGEAVGAQWDEIDLTTRTWTVPGNRMKAGREHRVALSDEAVEILKALPREKNNPYVFIGPRTGGLSNMAMAAVLRRMDRLDITVHGFRSIFRDWAAESTAFPDHVVEMALAHTVGNKVEAAYRRGDLLAKRQRLAAEWAKFCARECIGNTGSTVIPVRSKNLSAKLIVCARNFYGLARA
jgi:integrase